MWWHVLYSSSIVFRNINMSEKKSKQTSLVPYESKKSESSIWWLWILKSSERSKNQDKTEKLLTHSTEGFKYQCKFGPHFRCSCCCCDCGRSMVFVVVVVVVVVMIMVGQEKGNTKSWFVVWNRTSPKRAKHSKLDIVLLLLLMFVVFFYRSGSGVGGGGGVGVMESKSNVNEKISIFCVFFC